MPWRAAFGIGFSAARDSRRKLKVVSEEFYRAFGLEDVNSLYAHHRSPVRPGISAADDGTREHPLSPSGGRQSDSEQRPGHRFRADRAELHIGQVLPSASLGC